MANLAPVSFEPSSLGFLEIIEENKKSFGTLLIIKINKLWLFYQNNFQSGAGGQWTGGDGSISTDLATDGSKNNLHCQYIGLLSWGMQCRLSLLSVLLTLEALATVYRWA